MTNLLTSRVCLVPYLRHAAIRTCYAILRIRRDVLAADEVHNS